MKQRGTASWYKMGRVTASGEKMNSHVFAAAHKTLKFGTHVKVVNELNNKSVTVVINDRGPYVHGRIIDLTMAAAKKIGLVATGTAPVTIYW